MNCTHIISLQNGGLLFCRRPTSPSRSGSVSFFFSSLSLYRMYVNATIHLGGPPTAYSAVHAFEGIENNPIFDLFLRRRPFITPPNSTITLSTRSSGSIFIVCFIPVTSSCHSTSATWKPASKSTLIRSEHNIKVDICIYTHLDPVILLWSDRCLTYCSIKKKKHFYVYFFYQPDVKKLSVDQLMDRYLIKMPDCV